MSENTSIAIVITSIVAGIVSVIGLGIQSDRHNGDNTHKTSIACIEAGNEWRKVSPGNGRFSPAWSCVEADK